MQVSFRGCWLFITVMLGTVLTGCGTATHAVSVARATFKNPVYAHNFPDPFVLKVGKTFYAYATNSDSVDIPTLHSRDLVHWTAGSDAFPVPPRWVASDIWAPDVFRGASGKYVMYYAAHDTVVGHECLGRAVASSPTGPFIDQSSKPVLCQASLGGDIDPDVFRDGSGHVYLLWKNDGNCCGVPVHLYSQQLSSDGMTLRGKSARLLTNDASWEGNLIEAPFMWEHAGKYYLFFSANDYASFSYAVGYATCKGPLGPCTNGSGNPILSSKCRAAGPGGETIVADASGQTWMLYHAWRASAVDDATVGRELWMDRLDWKNSKPVVHGPTCTAQTGPAT